MNTIIAGSLIPNKLDTPLNARFRIETIEDVSKIEAPAVGELFYVRSLDKHYKIVSLKSKRINELVIDNAQIDEYHEFGAMSEEEKALYLKKEEAGGIYSTKGEVEQVSNKVEEVGTKTNEANRKADDALAALENVPTNEEMANAIQESKEQSVSFNLEDGDYSEIFDQNTQVTIVETGLPDVSI